VCETVPPLSQMLSCLIHLLRFHGVCDRGINEQGTVDGMIMPEKKCLMTKLSQCHFVLTTNGLRCSLGVCGMNLETARTMALFQVMVNHLVMNDPQGQ
jgi:hypothetical protein